MSYFTEEALAEYTRLVAEKLDLEFTEGEIYDFARCMRADGSFYGTSGKCRKGTEAGDAPERGSKIIGKATPAQAAALENKAHQMRMKNAQADRAAAVKKIAKEMGKSLTDPEVVKEWAKREKEKVAPAKTPTHGSTKKPRASAGELREAQAKLFDVAKERRVAAKEAEKAYKAVDKETKGDNSPEAKKRRLEAGRAWDKAGTAADRAQTAWSKAHERWSKASEREKRAKMSPSQKAETRRIDKIIKEQG